MLVFGDHVLRPYHLARGCAEFKSGLASIMMITPFSPVDQEHMNTAQVVELVLKNIKTQFKIYPLHWCDLWKLYPASSMYGTAGIQQCVHMVGTKKCGGSSRFPPGALSLLKSFKGEANGFPAAVMTLWDMGSPFYSKWAVIQWTHPSSLTATNCKVCQYAGRLWHLYSVLWHALGY